MAGAPGGPVVAATVGETTAPAIGVVTVGTARVGGGGVATTAVCAGSAAAGDAAGDGAAGDGALNDWAGTNVVSGAAGTAGVSAGWQPAPNARAAAKRISRFMGTSVKR